MIFISFDTTQKAQKCGTEKLFFFKVWGMVWDDHKISLL